MNALPSWRFSFFWTKTIYPAIYIGDRSFCCEGNYKTSTLAFNYLIATVDVIYRYATSSIYSFRLEREE